MGADPHHKDVFVELDYMPPHAVGNDVILPVVDAFRNAPVTNPDGMPGINLHVDNGPSSVMNPQTGEQWGTHSRQDQIPHVDILGTGTASSYNWLAFANRRTGSLPARCSVRSTSLIAGLLPVSP